MENGKNEKTKFQIRELEEKDMEAVRMMVQELAEFEKMPDGPTLTVEQLRQDLKANAFFGFIAVDGDEPAGMALCYLPYSTWAGVFLHLEDLYVRPQFRKSGLGRQLVQVVCKEAKVRNYKRIQWNVLDWNPAREFYDQFEPENISETEGWLTYRLGPEQINKFACDDF